MTSVMVTDTCPEHGAGPSASRSGPLPAYARSQLVFATVLLFLANALAFTAFAYVPPIETVRLVASLGVLPYGAFVAWVAFSHRDFVRLPATARRLLRVGAWYGGAVLTLTAANLGDEPVTDLARAVGLFATVAAAGVALPALITAVDYERIVLWTLRLMSPVALLGLVVELGRLPSVLGAPMLAQTVRGLGTATRSLFLHHTVVAHDFQWLPVFGLLASWTTVSGGREVPRWWRAVDAVAAAVLVAYIMAVGSRQGSAFVVLTGALVGFCRVGGTAVIKRWVTVLGLGLAVAWALALEASPTSTGGLLTAGLHLTGRATLWYETIVRIAADGRWLRGYGINPGLVGGWQPHNSPLAHLAAFGILGLAAYMALMVTACRIATGSPRTRARHRAVALILVFGLLLELGLEDYALRAYSGANLALWLLVGYLTVGRAAPTEVHPA